MKKFRLVRKAALWLTVFAVAVSLFCLPVFAAEESGSCGANVVWTYDDGTLTIEGSGAMTDYASRSEQPWADLAEDITAIRVNNGVTKVGDYAFYYCYNASAVILASSVTEIGEAAFWGCASLDGVTLPENLTAIGDFAFGSCADLNDLAVPASVTSLGDRVFEGCSDLNSAVILAEVETLGARTFFNCRSLTAVYLNAALQSIEQDAFTNCTSLTDLYVSGDLTAWAPTAADGNGAFTSLTAEPFNYGETATLTIEYVYEDGSEAAESYVAEIGFASPYQRTSPEIAGFETADAEVSGLLFGADRTVQVVYTAIEGYEESESETETEGTPSEEKEQNPVTAVIWIIVLVLIIGGIVVAAFFLLREKPAEKGAGNAAGNAASGKKNGKK